MNETVWQQFGMQEQLTDTQVEQFKKYAALLQEWNKHINLTAIETTQGIIEDHFQDSLALAKAFDVSKVSMLADVGTGAGFPGLALKIKYPHLGVILLEVTLKKITFLEHVVEQLNLDKVTIVSDDWRTFLRTTEYPLQLVCARASLQPDELVKMFKPSCPYKEATLVYWAAKGWEADKKVQEYFEEEISYQVGKKLRKLAIFTHYGSE